MVWEAAVCIKGVFATPDAFKISRKEGERVFTAEKKKR
jgi:hypothetical protein